MFDLSFRACKIDREQTPPRWRIKSMVTNNSPDNKPLQTASFVIHATRGVIRDQAIRRKTMFVLLLCALILLLCGSTLLQSTLNPADHPARFILFWIFCAWVTLTAILLAFFDLLMVRIQARNARRELRENQDRASPASPPEGP
ncbi:MAG: hypothetical protein QOH39_348 [Verrucomicrobiota bacterium]|jgi:hypothetical protein